MMVMTFDYDIALVLGVYQKELKVSSLMLIWRFLISFADS